MPLTAAQTPLYWRTWAKIAALLLADQPDLTKAQIAASRKSQHKAAKCPASSKDWTNADLNRWLAFADLLANPDDLDKALAFQAATHPEAARISAIQRILAQLGRPVSYAAACAHDPSLPNDLTLWPASALQAALVALARTSRRAQMPGKQAS